MLVLLQPLWAVLYVQGIKLCRHNQVEHGQATNSVGGQDNLLQAAYQESNSSLC